MAKYLPVVNEFEPNCYYCLYADCKDWEDLNLFCCADNGMLPHRVEDPIEESELCPYFKYNEKFPKVNR